MASLVSLQSNGSFKSFSSTVRDFYGGLMVQYKALKKNLFSPITMLKKSFSPPIHRSHEQQVSFLN
jgi:hypothetical protein